MTGVGANGPMLGLGRGAAGSPGLVYITRRGWGCRGCSCAARFLGGASDFRIFRFLLLPPFQNKYNFKIEHAKQYYV